MYIIWAFAGIIFLIADFKKKNPIFLALAYCSLFSVITTYKYSFALLKQMCAFTLFFLVFYPLVKMVYKKDEENIQEEMLLKDVLDKKLTVVKDIGKTISIDGIGLVEYKNKLFQAKNIVDKEIKRGEYVLVVSRENSILNVKTLNSGLDNEVEDKAGSLNGSKSK